MDVVLSNWELLAAALLTIGFGSVAKGITGVGLPILVVPVLAAFTSVEEAVVLMVLPGLAANSWLVVMHRQWPVLRGHGPFLLAGLLGGAIGTWLLSALDDRWLKLLLAVWLGLYLLQYFSGRPSGRNFAGRGDVGAALGFAAGTVQGASGISAPVVAPYFHASGLTQQAYAFATAFTFLLFAGIQVVAMSRLHLLTMDRLTVGAIIVIPTLLFTHLGVRWARKFSEAAFRRILLAMFIAMELKLVIDIVSAVKI